MSGPPRGASERVRFGTMLVLLALLAFALREHYLAVAIVQDPVRGDPREYVAYAWNLVHHGVFGSTIPPAPPLPDAYRQPGYPWLIALGMKLAHEHWYPLVLHTQAVLGTMTVVFAALLARQWASIAWSIAAGLVVALWPHHVAATNTLLSEVLFGFTLMAALLGFARAWATDRRAWFVLAGIAFGCAWLVNPLLLLFPPCLAVLAWRHGRRGPALLLLAAFLVPVLGMSLRNATIGAADRGSVQRATLNFVQGSWPEYHAAANRFRTGDPTAIAIMREIEGEHAMLQASASAGMARIGERIAAWPGYYAKWYASKPWVLWSWQIRLGATDISFHRFAYQPFDHNPVLRGVMVTYRWLNPMLTTLMLVAALGFVVAGVRRTAWMPAAATGALALYLTLVHVVLQAEPRYATAYRGLEAVLVATAVAWLAARWRSRRGRGPSSSGAGAAQAG